MSHVIDIKETTLAKHITSLQQNLWYASIMVLLAVIGLGMLLYEFSPWARSEVVLVTIKLDLLIAYIFLVDFFVGLLFNQRYSRTDYWRKIWLDFISSIPVTSDMARALRILRALRAVRVISTALDIWFTSKRYRNLKRERQ